MAVSPCPSITYKLLSDNRIWEPGSAVTTATAAASSFAGLATASFLLGMFQASIANSCVAITQRWWRRREQVSTSSSRPSIVLQTDARLTVLSNDVLADREQHVVDCRACIDVWSWPRGATRRIASVSGDIFVYCKHTAGTQ